MLPILSRLLRLPGLLSRWFHCRSAARSILPLVLPLLIIATGCTANEFDRNAAMVELSIRQAEASGRPGAYSVAGNTTLPDQTRLTISAVRDFRSPADRPVYAILDRQFVTVQQGSWETTLNLWQVAPDGRFQESWQLSPAAVASAEPAETVTFLATLDPANQPPTLKDQIEAQDNATQATLARFTTDGELYLEASKQVSVALPSGKTAPPAATAPAARVRTSGRPAEARDQDSQGWNQTNAPLSPDHLLR